MKQRQRLFPCLLLDATMMATAVLAAAAILPRLERTFPVDHLSPGMATFGWVALAMAPIVLIGLVLVDLCNIPSFWGPIPILRRILTVVGLIGAVYIGLSLFLPYPLGASRKAIVLSGVLTVLLLWLGRLTVPTLYGRPTRKRRMVLIGAHTFAVRALARYAREHEAEIEILGVVDDFKDHPYCESLGVRAFGGVDQLARVLERFEPDSLVVLQDQSHYSQAIFNILEKSAAVAEVYVRAQIPLYIAQDIDILFIQEVPLLKVYSRDSMTGSYPLRDFFDRSLALIGLILTAPVFLVLAPLIRLESPGPVFYRQRRLGKGNRPFWIYKFRSMVADAEKKSGAVLASKNDPRVTSLGRIMRATRLDEIPQLINVLFGEMSLIGPRPERPEFQLAYLETIPWYPLRSLCKPGITGLAQVTGDYHTSTQRKLLYDVTYLANMSPVLDIRILLTTLVTVLTKRGH